MDQLIAGLLHALLAHKHFLIKLFARAQAGENNGNVLIRPVSREENQIACQVENADRLPHVEDENLPAFGVRSRLKYQGNGLRYRHKIPDNIGVRDSHRPSKLDLAAEERDHAPVAPQHVPETHRHVFRFGAFVIGLDDHFTDALACAHDIGRIDGFISRDHHKTLYVMAVCGLHDF